MIEASSDNLSWLMDTSWTHVVTYCGAYTGQIPTLNHRSSYTVQVWFTDVGPYTARYAHTKVWLCSSNEEAQSLIRGLFDQSSL